MPIFSPHKTHHFTTAALCSWYLGSAAQMPSSILPEAALLTANIGFIRAHLWNGLGKVLISTGTVALQIRHSHKTAKYVLTRLLAYAKNEPCQDHP